ncbi:capsule biosynthesis protein [Paracoccus sp. p3-h83]|uniref:capsule biosynthesis protein n=1 Tax=Paracoccus sp. p3-h83 TaxID=3342805 RepID=UPI0035BAF834
MTQLPTPVSAAPPRPAPADQHLLFLQGPHGPFFRRLADQLRRAGLRVSRVGFNRGDQVFWGSAPGYIPYRGTPEDWPATLTRLIDDLGITGLVLYGDVRAIHAQAIAIARERGLIVHVFEEGYLRPYWATYERGGSNGHSRLMQIDIDAMARGLATSQPDGRKPPATWGDMREHVTYGFVYHLLVLLANRTYPGFRPHRKISVAAEFRLHLRKMLTTPGRIVQRGWLTRALLSTGSPYHLVLLQLEHDASFVAHSGYDCMADFTAEVLAAFAQGAPRHHRLVFKAHPLEDDRGRIITRIREQAAALGLADRVDVIPGGKLARLLAQARSAVTVNSTAAQQALLRGIPVRAMGRAVYAKPGIVSDQPLADFFAAPQPPDRRAYTTYREFLLDSSQVPGGFYSAHGRQYLLRQVTDLMLAAHDPYDPILAGARGGSRAQMHDG